MTISPLEAGRWCALALIGFSWIEVLPGMLAGRTGFDRHMPAQIRTLAPELWRSRDRPRLQNGDRVLAINGQPLRHPADWYRAFAAPAGSQLRIAIERAGAPVEILVTVEPEPWGVLSLMLFLVGTGTAFYLIGRARTGRKLLACAAFFGWFAGRFIGLEHWPYAALPVSLGAAAVVSPWLTAKLFWPRTRWIHAVGLVLALAQAASYVPVLVGGYEAFGLPSGHWLIPGPEIAAIPAQGLFLVGAILDRLRA